MSRLYKVEITGETPLLLHHDNLAWADSMTDWRIEADNEKKSKPGDDRTPAHRWIGCLYEHEGFLVIPNQNLMTLLREGGSRCSTGKGNKTYKRETQSGIFISDPAWVLLVNGRRIPMAPINELQVEPIFIKHEATVKKLGFELHVKRVSLNNKKHIRVRPIFRSWALEGMLEVLDDTITTEVLGKILTKAGALAGLGDWRPSAPRAPGTHGRFTAKATAV